MGQEEGRHPWLRACGVVVQQRGREREADHGGQRGPQLHARARVNACAPVDQTSMPTRLLH